VLRRVFVLLFGVRRCLCSSLQTFVSCLLPCCQLTENCVNVMNTTIRAAWEEESLSSGLAILFHTPRCTSQLPSLYSHIKEWMKRVCSCSWRTTSWCCHPTSLPWIGSGPWASYEARIPQAEQPLFKAQGSDSFLTQSRWRRKPTSQGLHVNGAGSAFLSRQTAQNNGSKKCVLPSFIALGDLPPSPTETMWTAIFRVSLLIILADRMGTG